MSTTSEGDPHRQDRQNNPLGNAAQLTEITTMKPSEKPPTEKPRVLSATMFNGLDLTLKDVIYMTCAVFSCLFTTLTFIAVLIKKRSKSTTKVFPLLDTKYQNKNNLRRKSV